MGRVSVQDLHVKLLFIYHTAEGVLEHPEHPPYATEIYRKQQEQEL